MFYRTAKAHLSADSADAYQLGQRFSEIVGLTWDRFDVVDRIYHPPFPGHDPDSEPGCHHSRCQNDLTAIGANRVLPQGTSSRTKDDRFSE